jgi:hypothetical protein
MSNDKGWWDRALGRAPAQPRPVQPQAYQPQPQPQQAPPPGYPQQGYQPPPQQYQQPQPVINNIHDAVGAMGMWQGGEAARTETHRCPQCGGGHFYSRAQGARRGPPPAPLCFDCGYNAMFDQGDPTNYAGA